MHMSTRRNVEPKPLDTPRSRALVRPSGEVRFDAARAAQ
jgi:hypothetical protein